MKTLLITTFIGSRSSCLAFSVFDAFAPQVSLPFSFSACVDTYYGTYLRAQKRATDRLIQCLLIRNKRVEKCETRTRTIGKVACTRGHVPQTLKDKSANEEHMHTKHTE